MKTTTMKNMVNMVALVADVVLVAGCHGKFDAHAATSAVPMVLSVTAAQAQLETLQQKVDVTGTLAAWEEATVSLEADGRIIDVRVDLGDRVQKGAVLARISPENYDYRKAQAEAEFAAATSEFERQKTLVEQDMSTKQLLDEANRRLVTAKANLALAAKQYEDTTLRSPITGAIARRSINLGEFVRTGAPAFTIVQTNPVKLQVQAPERYIADVKIGDAVTAQSEALPGKELSGVVTRISPSVSPTTRSFAVEARFDNADGMIKPGIFARAQIQTNTTSSVVTVPESALVVFAGNPRLFVVDNGKARERPIEVAGRYQGRVIVSKGLDVSETVVLSGVQALQEGTRIEVRNVPN